MADKSKIEWTDATWNPITGCTLVDEGCRNCYAAHLITSWPAIGNHPSRKGLARKNADGVAKFTGEVRFNAQWLDQPLRWKKPRKIFVCAHGDLFHESVPDAWIDQVFAVMALAPQHTFQVLTKRPDRARRYLGAPIGGTTRSNWITSAIGRQTGQSSIKPFEWPLRSVWLGTSISDQPSADLRIPDLLATPASIRFISAEPLLGPVDLRAVRHGHMTAISCLDWVICGGESGPNARPMHPDWARSVRDQCAAAGVPFHFKQWGEWTPGENVPATVKGRKPTASYGPFTDGADWAFCESNMSDPEADWDDEPDLYRIGKSRAGRLLDGVEHNGFPEVMG